MRMAKIWTILIDKINYNTRKLKKKPNRKWEQKIYLALQYIQQYIKAELSERTSEKKMNEKLKRKKERGTKLLIYMWHAI